MGSFGTEIPRAVGTQGESQGTYGGAEVYRTNGYGQNRDATRGTGMAQWEGKLGAHGSYRVSGTAYSSRLTTSGASFATTTTARGASVSTIRTDSETRR